MATCETSAGTFMYTVDVVIDFPTFTGYLLGLGVIPESETEGHTLAGRLAGDRDGERGFYLVMFTLMLPLLFGIMGLAVDLARYRHVQGETQKAADAAVACAPPIAIASCVRSHDSDGNLVCPTSLSFQSGAKSVGLTHGDGSSPINGNNTIPYFKAALQSPLTCDQPAESGTEIYLQNGNDISQTSVNDINAATNNGASPIAIIAPVIDKSCGSNGPTYNQTAPRGVFSAFADTVARVI